MDDNVDTLNDNKRPIQFQAALKQGKKKYKWKCVLIQKNVSRNGLKCSSDSKMTMGPLKYQKLLYIFKFNSPL